MNTNKLIGHFSFVSHVQVMLEDFILVFVNVPPVQITLLATPAWI